MSRFPSCWCCFLLLGTGALATPALAQAEINQAIESLQAKIKTLAEGTSPMREKREFQEAYAKHLTFLERSQQLAKGQRLTWSRNWQEGSPADSHRAASRSKVCGFRTPIL